MSDVPCPLPFNQYPASVLMRHQAGAARASPGGPSSTHIVATPLGFSIGYWFLRDQSEALQLNALAFTAGLLILAAVEEMLGQAREATDEMRISAGFFIGGFAPFTLVTPYSEVK